MTVARPSSLMAAPFLLVTLTSHLGAATATTPKPGEMNAHFINVGQGASVLLEFSCGAALMDTGGETNTSFASTDHLTTYLDAFFKRRADLKSTLALVIISHPHIDHTRGLPAVMRKYIVQALVDNGHETGSGGRQQKGAHRKVQESHGSIKYLAVSQRDTDVAAGATRPEPPDTGLARCTQAVPKFEFLWGGLNSKDDWPKATLSNENDGSVVTRLTFGKTAFLFPGDIEDDVQSEMIDQTCPGGAGSSCALNVDIYHVAHHGSHNGTTENLVEAMSPRVAVMSMGPPARREKWSAYQYGHPREVTIKRLLDPTNGVKDPRPSVTEKAAKRGASKKPASVVGSQFTNVTIDRAIYGTGWSADDNVVIAATAGGTWKVLSKVTP